ncbi:MAG: hypothetical protein ACR2M6_00690 [Vampirovibrionia bacterium]|jgi:hypothetical protein
MEIAVPGFKFNIVNAIIFVVVGFLVAVLTACSCSKVSVKEAMTNLANAAPLDHDNNKDLMGSWMSKAFDYAGNMGNKTNLEKHAEYKGTPVPLENTLFFFEDNKFKPECCPSTYSTSTGCACTSEEQMEYLNERGGNRTLPTEF